MEYVDTFVYMGDTIIERGNNDVEIRQRIEIARTFFISMWDVCTSKQ